VIILKLLSKLLSILQAGPSPAQIAGGFTLGMFLGLMPFLNLYSLLIFLLLVLINVNISAAMLSWAVFSLFAYLFDPVFHHLGYYLLVQVNWLQGFWTSLYNVPVFPLTRFNNTVVLGSFVISLLLTVPIFLLARLGVVRYREKLEPRVQKLRVIQILKSSKIYEFYQRVRALGI